MQFHSAECIGPKCTRQIQEMSKRSFTSQHMRIVKRWIVGCSMWVAMVKLRWMIVTDKYFSSANLRCTPNNTKLFEWLRNDIWQMIGASNFAISSSSWWTTMVIFIVFMRKLCGPYVITLLSRASIFEWYMPRLAIKKGQQEDMCYYGLDYLLNIHTPF